jgi:phage tail sheath gpL-like
MAITDIGQRKTPGTPLEITYSANPNVASDQQRILLVGREVSAAFGGVMDTPKRLIDNIDPVAAKAEVVAEHGDGEIADMVEDYVTLLNLIGSIYPTVDYAALDFNADNTALTLDTLLANIDLGVYEWIVIPIPVSVTAEITKLKNHCIAVSQATRTDNGQYGTIGIAASFTDAASLAAENIFDSRLLSFCNFVKTGITETQGQIAAQYAAWQSARTVPFNSVNKKNLLVTPSADETEWIGTTLTGGTEAILDAGYTPLGSDRYGNVRIVRSVLSVTTQDETSGGPAVSSYYDTEDQVILHYYRRSLWTRLNQPDFQNVKNSDERRRAIKTAAVNIASIFEDLGMFQRVEELAPFFLVEQNAIDRHRSDFSIPVNVLPNLQIIAGRIDATTRFDVLTGV